MRMTRKDINVEVFIFAMIYIEYYTIWIPIRCPVFYFFREKLEIMRTINLDLLSSVPPDSVSHKVVPFSTFY